MGLGDVCQVKTNGSAGHVSKFREQSRRDDCRRDEIGGQKLRCTSGGRGKNKAVYYLVAMRDAGWQLTVAVEWISSCTRRGSNNKMNGVMDDR